MFETAINTQPIGGDLSGSLFRRLDWPELAARLAAAHDLRAALARPLPAHATFASRNVAGLAGENAGERAINRDGLSCGKRPETMTAGIARRAVSGEQEA